MTQALPPDPLVRALARYRCRPCVEAAAVVLYPTRGARRRRKPTILACLHQTANAEATAIGERTYANRAGSPGPSATA
jgi:hypothetical protein